MRLFIAVAAADGFFEKAALAQRRLKPVGADVNWTKPEQLHFTLHFLGDVMPQQLPLVKAALDRAANIRQFELTCAEPGFFPDKIRPRVICLGAAETETLTALRDSIGAGLSEAGFAVDQRPFSAHLTLGRLCGQKHARELLLKSEAIAADCRGGIMPVNRVVLYESILLAQGAAHTELYSVNLKGVIGEKSNN